MKTSYRFTITYESIIDTDSGEILETKIIDKSEPVNKATKRKVIQEDSKPKLILEENKFRLTSSAVSLLGLNEDSKIDIKYEGSNGSSIPVIGTDEAFGTKGGNKLTKSNTVACRGAKNTELAKYGSEFTLVARPNKPGLFVLTSDNVKIEQLKGDDNVNLDEPFDLSIDELIDDEDTNISEIDSNFFKL